MEGLKRGLAQRRERAGEEGFNTLAALICSISIVTSAARSLVITAAMVTRARHRPGRSYAGLGDQSLKAQSRRKLTQQTDSYCW